MEYQIGEIVRVKDVSELADAESRLFNSKASRRSGMQGLIVDRLYSEANGCYVYYIKFDGDATASRCKFTEEEIEYVPMARTRVEFVIERFGDIINAVMYEDGIEVDRAYGNIRYDNRIGCAQAASHAMRTMYNKLKGEL